MVWPWATKSTSDPHDPHHHPSIFSAEFWKDPRTFLTPRVLIPATILATSSLTAIHFYRSYVRRIPEVSQIYPSFFRRRSLFGQVTSVGDGDNFRLYHTPGGRLLGWGWFPGRKVPTERKELKERTVHIRIAGVDAPESAHFGYPSQPHSAESLEWLRNYLLGKRVRAHIYRRDQYDRVVCSVKVWHNFWRRDVGLEMLKAGMAGVYEGKTGAEFGKLENKYRIAEAIAKVQKKGMWGIPGEFESPRTYKRAVKEATETAARAASATGGMNIPAKQAGPILSAGSRSQSQSTVGGKVARGQASGGVVVVGKASAPGKGVGKNALPTKLPASKPQVGKSTATATKSPPVPPPPPPKASGGRKKA